ncbi:MAG TPA: hypothetical protein VK834_12095, partial [Bradyrhizobium sp.]|nr:hypothetical protein [Bradyrhizobium sp.]
KRNKPRHNLADDTFLDVLHDEASPHVIKGQLGNRASKFCKTMTVTDGECKWHLNVALRPTAKSTAASSCSSVRQVPTTDARNTMIVVTSAVFEGRNHCRAGSLRSGPEALDKSSTSGSNSTQPV